jgi:threonine dehydratase
LISIVPPLLHDTPRLPASVDLRPYIDLYREMKLAMEPAGAAAMAAWMGPLRDISAGKRVGVIVCGSNIDADSFARFVRRGEESVLT